MKIRTAIHTLMSNAFALMIFDLFNMKVDFPCLLFLGEYEYPKESDFTN